MGHEALMELFLLILKAPNRNLSIVLSLDIKYLRCDITRDFFNLLRRKMVMSTGSCTISKTDLIIM